PNVMLILNDSARVMTDSVGQFVFPKAPLGDLHLNVDESSLPSYGSLFSPDTSVDSTGLSHNIWNLTVFSGDSVNQDIPLQKLELFSVLSKQSTLEMRTEMLTEEFRLLVYKPWSLLIRIGFRSGSATLQSEIFNELRNIGDLMKWQTQINLDINGHTDNQPVSAGSGFKDNQELSESRAMAIRTYLMQTMGISGDRIRAFGHGDTLAMVGNNTPEGRALNRRVELVFYNAAEEDSDYDQLEFMYNIDYSGEISVSNIRFHQELPLGFVYKTGTATLDSTFIEPIAHGVQSDVWSFDDWNAETHTAFDMSMEPDDFDLIQNTGLVSAYLDLVDSDGNIIVTDTLETQISTLVEELSFNMILEGTQFDVGSADLKPSAYPSLQKMGKFLAWQPDITVVIEGFTDSRGSLEFNMLLSEWRAVSVKNYLVENYSVNPDNIFTHGLGPHYPVGDNETWLGRAENRRVEVLVNAEVGEAALLELDVIKESLKRIITIPIDPLESMTPDSALSIPGGQASTLLFNMSYPAYAGADSMAITLVLPNDLEYVDVAGTLKTWGHLLYERSVETIPSIQIFAPDGVVGERELFLNVMLFKDEVPLSSNIERVLKVNIEEPGQRVVNIEEPAAPVVNIEDQDEPNINVDEKNVLEVKSEEPDGLPDMLKENIEEPDVSDE
ncbi:MAG: OmpA family protein, partial [Candidatus Marinimicrobia bacterium]|nr:OmpA family protein [Candidatus Neomarinimicrobiota bacterium]